MRKFVLFLFVLALLAAGILGALRAGPEPAIVIEPSAKAIGRKTPVTVEVSEPKRGLAGIKVELVQGELFPQRTGPAVRIQNQPACSLY